MRIGLDARFFGPQAGTGIGRYTRRLIEGLEAIDDRNEYVVFLREDNFGLYQPRHARFRKVLAPWRWYSIGEQISFPRLLRREQLDLVHFLSFNVPLQAPRPFVVTIHDLILNKFPTERASTLGPVLYWAKHSAYLQVVRRAVRRAAAIVAVTEHTKQDVLQEFGVPSTRVRVTYEACDPPTSDLVDRASLGRLGIRDPYVVNVGNAYPHKNLERLIEAVAVLRRNGERVQLVLVGREDYFARRLRHHVAQRQLADAVIFTGFVDDRELETLYRAATMYVCPSLYEGFGLSGLEAMARGVPVIAANRSSLPEVYGSAAEYIEPESVESIAVAVRRLLHDRSRRDELIRLGRACVAKYSWERMARETLAVYTGFEQQPHA